MRNETRAVWWIAAATVAIAVLFAVDKISPADHVSVNLDATRVLHAWLGFQSATRAAPPCT